MGNDSKYFNTDGAQIFFKVKDIHIFVIWFKQIKEQEIMKSQETCQKIAFISLNFTFISKSIKELEKKGLKLSESPKIYQLSDKRQSFTLENLEMSLISHFQLSKL